MRAHPARKVAIAALNKNPDMKHKELVTHLNNYGYDNLKSNTVSGWLKQFGSGKGMNKSKALHVKPKLVEAKPTPGPVVQPEPVDITPSSVAKALLIQAVNAIEKRELLEAHIRELRSTVARLEERSKELDSENQRIRKIHNDYVRHKDDEGLPDVAKLVGIAKLRERTDNGN